MKNFRKTGLLVAILVIPVFIFMFLKSCGENHYQLPTFIPLVDSTTGGVLLKKNNNPHFDELEFDTVYHSVPDFDLIDQNGAVFKSKQALQNSIYVANFFFTRCGSICPKMSTQLTRVQDNFTSFPDVKLISISVDPEFDSVDELRKYAKDYDAVKGKWYFLRGEKKLVYPLAVKGFFIPVADASEYDKAIRNPDETFIHSEKLVLVDKQNHIRGFYDGTDKADVDRLMLEIKVLQATYKE
ncbi:MAG: SCO family protein [Pseudarcicella sp.]|nr:SCO family protein [Pseudarcicella sp.]